MLSCSLAPHQLVVLPLIIMDRVGVPYVTLTGAYKMLMYSVACLVDSNQQHRTILMQYLMDKVIYISIVIVITIFILFFR